MHSGMQIALKLDFFKCTNIYSCLSQDKKIKFFSGKSAENRKLGSGASFRLSFQPSDILCGYVNEDVMRMGMCDDGVWPSCRQGVNLCSMYECSINI